MRSIINIVKISLLSLLVAACNKETEKQEQTSDLPSFTTFALKTDTLNYNLTLPGDLNPYDQVTLYAKVEGFISELLVDRGDEVEKGQVLAKIDAPEMEQQYLAAKSNEREVLERLNYSAENYQSLKNAAKTDGAVSTMELEQAKSKFVGDSAALNAAKAEVLATKQLKDYRIITAPFKGVITRRMISPGALVGPGKKEALFHLSREDKLRLEVAVPDKHGSSLPLNSTASFQASNRPGEKFDVQLSRSSKSLDPKLRSLLVEFDVDNPDQKLSAGSYVDVDLNLNRSYPTFQVPQSSIIETRKNIFVARVTDNKVDLVPVITGISTAQNTEVFGDLEEDDQIIEKGNTTLKDGMEVNAEN